MRIEGNEATLYFIGVAALFFAIAASSNKQIHLTVKSGLFLKGCIAFRNGLG